MNIHMIVERPRDRLNWQYQLNQFRGKVDFTLSTAQPSLNYIEKEALKPNDILVVILNSLEEIPAISEGIRRLIKEINVVAVVSKACEMDYGKDLSEKILEGETPVFNAVYFETTSNPEDLYQCLFKPRKNKNKERLPAHLEDETVLMDTSMFEGSQKKGYRGLFKSSRERDHPPFKRKKSPVLKDLEKQPRMRICVHGKSPLAYELGAVLSSVSDQSVLVMDLDRMSPTADIYCGVKPVVSEKYDFYSKATATGLNILLDCMKKSELGREAFRLCTQKTKGYPNLHILTGVYKLEDYEYYKSEELKMLIDKASSYYDVVLLRTNSFPYDGFTLNGFLIADWILCGVEATIENVRYNRQLIQLMDNKQKIPMEKQLWTLFESSKMQGLERNFLIEMGLGTYCGSIPYSEKREKCQRVGEGYLDKQGRELEAVYLPIIKMIYKGGR